MLACCWKRLYLSFRYRHMLLWLPLPAMEQVVKSYSKPFSRVLTNAFEKHVQNIVCRNKGRIQTSFAEIKTYICLEGTQKFRDWFGIWEREYKVWYLTFTIKIMTGSNNYPQQNITIALNPYSYYPFPYLLLFKMSHNLFCSGWMHSALARAWLLELIMGLNTWMQTSSVHFWTSESTIHDLWCWRSLLNALFLH